MEKAAKLRAARKNHVDPDATFKPKINKESSGAKPPDIKPYGWKEPNEENNDLPPDALDEFNATAGGKLNVKTGSNVDDIPIKPASGNIYEKAGGGMYDGVPLMSPSGDALTKEVRNRKDVKAKPRRQQQQKPDWNFDTESGRDYQSPGENNPKDELDSHSNFDEDLTASGRRRTKTPGGQSSASGQPGSNAPPPPNANWNHKHTRALPGVGENGDWIEQMRDIPVESPRLNVRGGLQKGDSASNLAVPGARVPTAKLSLLKKKLNSRGVSRSKSAASAQKKVGRRRSAHRAQTTPPRPQDIQSITQANTSNYGGGGGYLGGQQNGMMEEELPPQQPRQPRRQPRRQRPIPAQQDSMLQQEREEEMMRQQEALHQPPPPQPVQRRQPRNPRRPRPGSSEAVEESPAKPAPGFNSNTNPSPFPGQTADSARDTLEFAAPDGSVIDTELFPCSSCGRKFNSKALQIHQRKCDKVFGEKRKAFNTQAQRITGKEHEKMLKQAKRKEVQEKREASKPKRFEDQPIKGGKKPSKWKAQSDQLREAMKQQRLIAKYEKEGKSLAELPPVAAPSGPDPSLIQCPHCQRRFNEKAAERHIPKCATIINKPKTLQRGARVALGAAARKNEPATRGRTRRNRALNR